MSVGIINPDVMEQGSRIALALMEGGAAGWSTLLGKDVSYAAGASDYGRPSEVVSPEDFAETVMTTVDWTGDHPGTLVLLVPAIGAKEVVAQMMALMLGNDVNPAATKLDGEGMDAYCEAVNSFFGQGTQRVRIDLGGNAKAVVGKTELVNFSATEPENVLPAEDLLCVKIKVTIEGQASFQIGFVMTRSVTGVSTETDTSVVAKPGILSGISADPTNLAIAMKITLPLVVNIAVKKMRMEQIQDLSPGSIIEFKKMSGENLDLIASNVKIATAEAVIVNQCFGVQIRSIVDPRSVNKD